MSRGTSGEAAGRLDEEKVGVTAGIVTDDDVAIQNDFATNLNKYVKAIDDYITL